MTYDGAINPVAQTPGARVGNTAGSLMGNSVGWKVGGGQEGDHISHMATVSVSVSVSVLKARLSEFLRRVRAGDTLVVTDRGAPVAMVASLPEGEYEGSMNVLVEQGLVRPPSAVLPEDFWSRPRPKDPSGCCCAAVLQERARGTLR